MHNNHCYRVTAHLQLNILYYILFIMGFWLGYGAVFYPWMKETSTTTL